MSGSPVARRRWPLFVLGAVLGGTGTLVAVRVLADRADEEPPTSRTVELATASVEQRDLQEEIEWTGTLGYGELVSVSGVDGTITSIASARVDRRPRRRDRHR